MKYVFDANIPIAFTECKQMDLLIKFFQDETEAVSLSMSQANYDECMSCYRKLNETQLAKIAKTNTLNKVTELKTVYAKWHRGPLHGGDTDFHAIACAIIEDADVFVSNDRALTSFFFKYLNYAKLKKPKIMTLAGFLSLIIQTRRNLATTSIHALTNLDAYAETELPAFFKSIRGSQMDPALASTYANELKGIFNDYKNNIMKLV